MTQGMRKKRSCRNRKRKGNCSLCKIEMKEMSEEDWEDEEQCWKLKQAWLKDFPEVFKEDLGKEDRIDCEPIVVDLV